MTPVDVEKMIDRIETFWENQSPQQVRKSIINFALISLKYTRVLAHRIVSENLDKDGSLRPDLELKASAFEMFPSLAFSEDPIVLEAASMVCLGLGATTTENIDDCTEVAIQFIYTLAKHDIYVIPNIIAELEEIGSQ